MPAIRVGEMEKEFEKIDLNRDAKIIIIGAGISGIAAADYLTRAGFTDFKILEASNRTGGRIYTVNVGECESLKSVSRQSSVIHYQF